MKGFPKFLRLLFWFMIYLWWLFFIIVGCRFFSLFFNNIYSTELPPLWPCQSKHGHPELSCWNLWGMHWGALLGSKILQAAKGRFLTSTPGSGCQALPPTLAKCDWSWKMQNNSDRSLSSSYLTGAPKAEGPVLKSLEEFTCGIKCPLALVLMDGRNRAEEVAKEALSWAFPTGRSAAPNLPFKRIGKLSPRKMMGLKT